MIQPPFTASELIDIDKATASVQPAAAETSLDSQSPPDGAFLALACPQNCHLPAPRIPPPKHFQPSPSDSTDAALRPLHSPENAKPHPSLLSPRDSQTPLPSSAPPSCPPAPTPPPAPSPSPTHPPSAALPSARPFRFEFESHTPVPAAPRQPNAPRSPPFSAPDPAHPQTSWKPLHFPASPTSSLVSPHHPIRPAGPALPPASRKKPAPATAAFPHPRAAKPLPCPASSKAAPHNSKASSIRSIPPHENPIPSSCSFLCQSYGFRLTNRPYSVGMSTR